MCSRFTTLDIESGVISSVPYADVSSRPRGLVGRTWLRRTGLANSNASCARNNYILWMKESSIISSVILASIHLSVQNVANHSNIDVLCTYTNKSICQTSRVTPALIVARFSRNATLSVSTSKFTKARVTHALIVQCGLFSAPICSDTNVVTQASGHTRAHIVHAASPTRALAILMPEHTQETLLTDACIVERHLYKNLSSLTT